MAQYGRKKRGKESSEKSKNKFYSCSKTYVVCQNLCKSVKNFRNVEQTLLFFYKYKILIIKYTH